METSLQRLKQFIDYHNISVSAFEKFVGFSNGALASQIKNKKTIGVDKLENILRLFPNLSADWLLRGEGAMLRVEGENRFLSKKNKGVSSKQENIVIALSNTMEQNEKDKQKENSESIPVSSAQTKKLLAFLKKHHPDLYVLTSTFDTIELFQDALTQIEHKIISELDDAIYTFPGGFDYDVYKERAIKLVQLFKPYQEPVNDLSKAIYKFYDSMNMIESNTIDFDQYKL